MRKTAVGETAIRSRHAVLRAALAQAVRWDWVSTNGASNARLRQRRQTQRESMSVDEVWAVITAAATIDRAGVRDSKRASVLGGAVRASTRRSGTPRPRHRG